MTKHQPVLLSEVLRYLAPQTGDTYLDLTAGYGGHAASVLELTKNAKGMTLVDRDAKAVNELQKTFGKQAKLLQTDFLTAAKQLLATGESFDCILADLGVSSPHLDNANRGFSLQADGPLDMRMDQSQELTAERIVNHFDVDALTDIITRYGEEPKARKIAKAIVEHRPILTTLELAEVVARALSARRHQRVHPATRVFQALRIAVNDELNLLQQALPIWIQLLKPGGRIGIISFHSLEDRLVKQAFAEVAGNRYDAELQLLTKNPVTASPHELAFNPRARSAKLRAAAKYT